MNSTPMSNNMIAKKCANLLHFYDEILQINEIITSIPQNKKNYTFQSKKEIIHIEPIVDHVKLIPVKVLNPAQNIDELKKQLLQFKENSFEKSETTFVFGDGNPNADLLILGDAPSFDDVQLGKPFMGIVGQLLDRMLGFISVTRAHCFMSNVTFWHKPQNHQFSAQEIEDVIHFVHQMIKLINPKIIVTLGATATNALLNKPQGITQLRGKFHPYPMNPDIMILPSFHPSSLLTSPQNKQLSWRDLLLLKSKIFEMESSK
ncbi:MAG: uracil-DNA glycosylase [Alphaproteobacteria bacterium]|nr:uracil-DNA glycosylase [Alphaproteobacteria bacterium]